MKNNSELDLLNQLQSSKSFNVVQQLKSYDTLALLFEKLQISDQEIFDHAIEFFDIYEQSLQNQSRVLKTNVIRENGKLKFFKLFSNNNEGNRFKILSNTLFSDISEPNYNASIKSILNSENRQNLFSLLRNLDTLGRSFSNFVYLSGPIVSGKSYILSAISNYYALKDKKVAFLDLKKLFSAFLDLFAKKSKINFLTHEIMNSEILLIDNFGFKHDTEWFVNVIIEILKHRAEKNLITFLASEMQLKQFNNTDDVNALKLYKIISQNSDFVLTIKG
ncbi:hypothetical protein C4M97_02275 [Mycoplasmopsis pullorum]|uniref:ATP-binding protein n=1 Tax=Mycoplasmopsis pullorum TaxID=48003 RepID=UPI001117D051|nr:ATP-binding protein [Mycoplasmopsis pullorum]TNK81971.1 hypothetical protein C4M94_02435 [Mycoplasmopsis pullorum]TNK83388.1 hypothetical protein C4M80_00505 [Mycoplasmopsis pullorum]TNK85041.1 hypothetical protein C4M81_00530 [Mycoplasmopsis pullorum]TNK85285.1 hypothetical protein C4M92_01890 [Mycoplasmopsis pullorum]TNK86178.1 hypothetical protein C4M85_00905 [Mycoplasmopsis pullorum]